MAQGFHSDDANLFQGGSNDSTLNNVGGYVAPAGYLVQKYRSIGFSSSNSERIANEDPFETLNETQSDSSISRSIKQALVESKFYEEIRHLPRLNLKLENWKSLAVDIENYLSKMRSNQSRTQMNHNNSGMTKPERANFVSQQMTEKLKASNFPALVLRIGSWERVTRHEGDLVAKCYYAKKKLVWEFLEVSLKRKIEIQWADIVGIRATIGENGQGILELELRQPPTFHHEMDPQPRKHTNWRVTEDFTEGQALLWRIHYLEFPPGGLDRHFEKLLQCENRLFELSRKPFPTMDSRHFLPTNIYGNTEFSLDFIGQIMPQSYHDLHLPHSHLNPSLFSAQQVLSCQPTMQMQPSYRFKASSSPDPAEIIGNNHYVDNPVMPYWGQATNNFQANQVQAHLPMASTTQPVVSYQDNNYAETESMDQKLYCQILLNAIKNNLTNDIEHIGEKCSNIPRIASYEALLNKANYVGQDIYAGGNMQFSAHDHSNDTTTEHVYPQPVAWMQPQDSENPLLPAQATQVMPMILHENSFMYQRKDEFATFNDNGDNNHT